MDAHHDLARRVEDEAGGLQVHRVRVDEGASEVGDRPRVGAEPDREGQAVLGDEADRGGVVIDRQGDDPDANCRSLPPGQVAYLARRLVARHSGVRSPGSPVIPGWGDHP